jgi:hypothetical protein
MSQNSEAICLNQGGNQIAGPQKVTASLGDEAHASLAGTSHIFRGIDSGASAMRFKL